MTRRTLRVTIFIPVIIDAALQRLEQSTLGDYRVCVCSEAIEAEAIAAAKLEAYPPSGFASTAQAAVKVGAQIDAPPGT